MATFNFFNAWKEYMVEGVNCGTDQFAVALCAAANAPVATNSVLADLTQISYTNLSSRNLTTSSSSQSSGTYKLIFDDLTLTASGGSVATFRYVVIHNTTVAGSPLMGWYDCGLDVTLADTETFLIDYNATNGQFSLA